MVNINGQDYLTIEDLMERSGLARTTVLRYINEGKIAARKIGAKWLVKVEEFEDYIEKGN